MMLEQLIYTRCRPIISPRDLSLHDIEGFGVFSVSSGIANLDVQTREWIMHMNGLPNGAKEFGRVGLINSYDYYRVDDNNFCMTYENARPYCKVPRANGLMNKPGNFIKQNLIGDICGFPYLWFGASVWNAHLISENDYYHYNDDYSPISLKKMDCVPFGGYITTTQIRRFIEDGRQEAVKAGIAFLIEELSKDENKRKILLIRDIPSNVELWIASFLSAFPATFSKEISFSTNKTRFALGTKKTVIFYYTDKKNQERLLYYNKKRGITRRHPLFMIVGFHPEDAFCYHVTKEDNNDWVLIDGVQKTALFKASNGAGVVYYTDAITLNDRFLIFRDEILPQISESYNISEIENLYEIFCREWNGSSDVKKQEEAVISACKDYIMKIQCKNTHWRHMLSVIKRNKLLKRRGLLWRK